MYKAQYFDGLLFTTETDCPEMTLCGWKDVKTQLLTCVEIHMRVGAMGMGVEFKPPQTIACARHLYSSVEVIEALYWKVSG